jgi:hypothetical protein
MLAAGEVLRVRHFPQRVLAGAWIALLLLGAARLARRASPALRAVLPTALWATTTALAIALAPVALAWPNFVSVTQSLLPVLSMLAVMVWLPWESVSSDPSPPFGLHLSPHTLLFLAVALFAVSQIVGHRWAVGNFVEITDEASYALQSGWMRLPGFSWHFDPALKDFFVERHLVYREGQLATQYAPGWPLMLSLFDAAGLRQVWGLVVGTVTLLATFRIGCLLANARTGMLAAVLLATSQWFVDIHSGYMSHGTSMLFAACGALALFEAEQRAGGPRIAAWLAAGFCVSGALATRPLTGATLGAGLVLCTWLNWPARITDRVQQVAWLAAGALPGLAFLLYYNAQTTGSPWLFGYTAAHGSLHALGFGRRGFTFYDETLHRVPGVGMMFTPRLATSHLSVLLANVGLTWLPMFSFVPLFIATRVVGVRVRVWRWLPLLLLPAAYFFYFFVAVRFWIELLPLCLIGVAWLLLAIVDRAPRLGRALVAIALIGQVPFAVARRGEQPYPYRPWFDYANGFATKDNFKSIERLREQFGRILVFAHDDARLADPLFDRVMLYNGRGDAGDVLVARDLGDRNRELIQRYPDRRAFLLVRIGPFQPAAVTPIPATP